MSPDETNTFDLRLRDRMQFLGISSFRQLAKRCGVSRYSIEKLRKGKIETLSVTIAEGIAAGLQFSLMDLLTWVRGGSSEFQQTTEAIDRFSAECPASPQPNYQQEYEHLHVQFLAQRDILKSEFQQEAIDRLESWLRNWPKVVYAVTHDKPDLLASKILPLLRPLESLLQAWGLEAIGSLGDGVPYNPHHHQLITNLDAILPGAIVEIQRPGYLHHGKLIFRAEVSLLPEA